MSVYISYIDDSSSRGGITGRRESSIYSHRCGSSSHLYIHIPATRYSNNHQLLLLRLPRNGSGSYSAPAPHHRSGNNGPTSPPLLLRYVAQVDRRTIGRHWVSSAATNLRGRDSSRSSSSSSGCWCWSWRDSSGVEEMVLLLGWTTRHISGLRMFSICICLLVVR
ncbi:hypothetical protein F4779DRAFT_115830 [Xylariaceae sp. FL0662B]|nr:hypothetical protein F4779DRAFT_115830 [Xylariaceae sp. FL0662B]